MGAISALHSVEVPIDTVIFRNIGLPGGVAPVRRYVPELLPNVLEARSQPGRVIDFETIVDGIVDAYAAIDQRRAINSWVRVGAL